MDRENLTTGGADKPAERTGKRQDRGNLAGGPDDPRRLGRQLALQFLYQLDMQEGAGLDRMPGFLDEYSDDSEARALAENWIKGVWGMHQRLDELIGRLSENWDLSRISRVDRSNLRLAVYQLIECPDIPAKVVINEAVELAKTFSTAQAPAFVNGVIDAVRKAIADDQETKEG